MNIEVVMLHINIFILYIPPPSSAGQGMSLRNLTSLGSNLASVKDLKRIETLHSLCCDSGGY